MSFEVCKLYVVTYRLSIPGLSQRTKIERKVNTYGNWQQIVEKNVQNL